MNEEDIALFNDSFERCSASADFLERFYTLFLGASDAVAKKFERTDLKKQARMLKVSLYTLMMASCESERAAHLEHLARRHSRADLDITPELYDLWLAQLLRAVAEADPKFDAPTEIAWRRAMQPGIDFMRSRY